MNRTEYLLTCLAEECNEIAQRASKAVRFGLDEIQEGQSLSNAQRITYEFRDLQAIMELLEDDGFLEKAVWTRDHEAIGKKKVKIKKWANHSMSRGILEEPNAIHTFSGRESIGPT